MAHGEPQPATLSPAEVATAIRALPPAGWSRLDRIAGYYARACSWEPADLRQEAFARALTGDRRCPVGVDVIRFLAQVMRSIASDSQKADKRKATQVGCTELHVVALDEVVGSLGSPSPTPEAALIEEEEEARFKRAVVEFFEDNLAAQMIVEGDLEGMEAEEIRSVVGLDKKAYATARRFIRRHLDKVYAKGGKP
jgi:DNA-directed RNA polymerase specialized sigma24 family protein